MRTRFRSEADGWSVGGRKITDATHLAAVRDALEGSPVIVERWFYRGSSAPERRVFDDWEDFSSWLNAETFAGDAIWVWNYGELCRDDNAIASGKCPDERGEVPSGGAY